MKFRFEEGTYPFKTLTALCFDFMFVETVEKDKSRNPNGLFLPPGPKKFKSVHYRMDALMPFIAYDMLWRQDRKLFHEHFQPHGVHIQRGS